MIKAGLGMIAVLAGLILPPAASALSPPRIYWADRGADTIGMASADGTSVHENFIVGANLPEGVAVDGQHIYWANAGSGTIGRANLDGSGVNESFISGASSPEGIAVDSRHIYWTNGGANIGEANLDGTGVNQSFIRNASGVTGLAVDGRHIYWANNGNGTVGRANLDGTQIDQGFLIGVTGPVELAVDSQHIYWTGSGAIGEANLDGTGVNNGLIGGLTDAFGLALDGQRVYWANVAASKISAAELNGPLSNPSLVAVPNSGNPFGVAVSVPIAQVGTPTPFAPTPLRTLSAPDTVTISNTGQADLSVDALWLTGSDPGDFLLTSNGCSASVAPGQSCQLTINFAPQAEGSRSATLEIASNDFADSPYDVPLSATAVAPPAPSGATGPTGSPEPPGTGATTGTAGSTGTTGSPGATGRLELVTCKTARRHRHTVRECRGRAISGTVNATSASQAKLTRGRRTYATGVGAQLDRGTIELVLRELRRIRPGRYTLTLHHRRMAVEVLS